MKRYITLAVFLVAVSCQSANAPVRVKLSGSELKEAQDIAIGRQTALLALQIEQNRYNEKIAELNLRSQTLCFELMKNHKLDASKQYHLEEWNGELVKQ